ncbi:MAG: TonB-dependent receptor [Colwellia sp.]|nr:TonB-dependent receptor [Colwellia sp.]
MVKKHKLSAISTAISLALVMSPGLYAEELDNKKVKDKEIEVIEVTGFKGSLLRSLNNKRFSDGVTDSIFAEDIGKTADQDIGEALQRITGVSITQGGGNDGNEGTNITIRGAGPNLNNIMLNGVSLTSSGDSQAVDLSAFSADILSSIVVSKTSSASQNEGSLGANVELKTFRPLDGADKAALDVQGRYDDYAKEGDYKVSGSFSEKFLNDTLGFYVTAFSETASTRRDTYIINGWNFFNTPNAIDSVTGEETGAVRGLQPGTSGYALYENKLERQGFTTALQWELSEATELNFNVTYSDQYRETTDNSMVSVQNRFAYEDQDLANLTDPNNPWVVYDAASQSFTKKINRLGYGRIESQEVGVDTDNTVVNLELSHYFTDNFSMILSGGYSKTKVEDVFYARATSSQQNNVPDMSTVPSDLLQPTGYDCTTGNCYVVAGTAEIDLENETSLTSFNPNDINSLYLGGIRTRDNEISDESKSLFVDFDWQVDLGPITSFEFGGKYEKRDKDVWLQTYNFGNGTTPDGWDERTNMNDITLSEISGGKSPEGDEFLADLGYDRTNTSSWETIDPRAAVVAVFGDELHPTFNPNLSNDRQVELENMAAYVQANFAMFDEKLTGNFGLRYVKSKVESTGYSGASYKFPNVMDRDLIATAADSSNPACTAEQLASVAGGFDANGVWGQVPGQACYDAGYSDSVDELMRYEDLSMTESPAKFQSTASNTTENWLPSFNLNYALNEDTIIRFSASQTMARPQIDNLTPAANYSEQVYGAGVATGTINNPNLKALESTNLDLSYEWYFNDGGAISVALFNKDMSNFMRNDTQLKHWLDMRDMTDEERSMLSQDDIIMDRPVDAEGNPTSLADNTGCLYNRKHKWSGAGNDPEVTKFCDDMNVTSIVNGAKASNRGIELGYNQNFDFLPGIWGGLGTAMNYTYSDSEQASVEFDNGFTRDNMPMVNVSKHVYNISTFWQQDGHLIRLAWNHRSDSLANGGYQQGALWNEGSGQLDISANYKVNDFIDITFNAVNVNNRENRQYYTVDNDTRFEPEGNPLEGGVSKSKTVRAWTMGTVYRLGVRVTF